MPRHRFGASMQKARQNLADRAEEAKMQAARADLSLMNEGSLADAAVLAAQGAAMRELNREDLRDDIMSEGNENALAWYPLISVLGEKILPHDVRMNGKTEIHEHLSDRRFGGDPNKVAQGRIRLSRVQYAYENDSGIEVMSQTDYDNEEGAPTPDKLNKLGGYITMDQRVSAQLSIAASMILRSILDKVPSKEIPDPTSNFKTKNVIYVESLVDYIHSNFARNITLDPSTGDAFERLTKGDMQDFTRSLIRTFLKARAKPALANEVVDFKETVTTESGTAVVEMKIGKVPSLFEDVYKARLEAMCTVSKENVGKVWQSKTAAQFEKNYGRSLPYNAFWIAVATYLKANSRVTFGTRVNLPTKKSYDVVFDVACSILSLICLHVISYAISYAVDAYIRLAIRGAERNQRGAIVFNHENVITPQIIFPGIRAALELYGVSAQSWDKEVAFQLNTNKELMAVFLAAKKAYDIDNTKPGVRRFSNPVAEDPYWARDRASQSARQSEWDDVKGRYNPEAKVEDISLREFSARNNANNLARSLDDARHQPDLKTLQERAGLDVASTQFGRRRRRGSRKKRSSFGKKHRGGSKKRRAGSNKRRGSKKH